MLYGTSNPWLPEFPVASVVFALGVFEVTVDVPTGFAVVHVSVTLQLLAPEGITQLGLAGVSVPVVAPWHRVPFHVVPEAQLDVAVREASS